MPNFEEGCEALLAKGNLLFLQGPIGPFFARLAKSFSQLGYRTYKINFNGGDHTYAKADQITDFTGSLSQWPEFLRRYINQYYIDTVFVFDDSLVYHRHAQWICSALGIRFYVFGKGYLNPNTITLEHLGHEEYAHLNVSSYDIEAAPLSDHEPVGNTRRHCSRFATRYYLMARIRRRRYPLYRHHRFSLRQVFLQMLKKRLCSPLAKLKHKRLQHKIAHSYHHRFFLVPLPTGQKTLRHDDTLDTKELVINVLESFARSSTAEQILLFSSQTREKNRGPYHRFIQQQAKNLGIEARVLYNHNLPYPQLLPHCIGVISSDEKIGFASLQQQLPIKATEKNILTHIKGLTFEGELDNFWQQNQESDLELIQRALSYIDQKTQIHGSFFRKWRLSCTNVIAFYEAHQNTEPTSAPDKSKSSKIDNTEPCSTT